VPRADARALAAARRAQIIAIQALFYISLGFLLLVSLGARATRTLRLSALQTRHRALMCCVRCPAGAAGPVAPQLSLFYFFDYSALSMHSFMGWCAPRCFVRNGQRRDRQTRSGLSATAPRLAPLPARSLAARRLVITAHLVNAALGCALRAAACACAPAHARAHVRALL
jgi:hypothetical protein